MSDLTAARKATSCMLSPYDFKLENQPLATGAVAFQGGGAAVDTAGNLVRASAATAVKTVGYFCGQSIASAAAGDLTDVQQGIGYFANGSAALSAADRFQPCYWEDDQTVGKDPSGLFAGLVVDVDAGGVFVALNPFTNGASNRTNRLIAGGAAYTVKTEDDGATIHTATDNAVITLPAVSAENEGMIIEVVNTGADGAALVSVSPAAADAIFGTIANAAADSVASGTDNQGMRNTKATANKGDYIRLQSDGVNGWYVKGGVGIWAAF